MGVESSGDDCLTIYSKEDEKSKDEDEDEEVAAVLGGDAAIDGNHSHTNTSTALVDGGLEVVVAEEGGIHTIPPFITQQFAEVCYASISPPLTQTQQQLAFAPELMHP
jgi:hypothetical protein